MYRSDNYNSIPQAYWSYNPYTSANMASMNYFPSPATAHHYASMSNAWYDNEMERHRGPQPVDIPDSNPPQQQVRSVLDERIEELNMRMNFGEDFTVLLSDQSPDQPHSHVHADTITPEMMEQPDYMGTNLPSRKQLETISINSITSENVEDEQQCIVCMETFTEGEKVRQLQCGHKYHQDCIFKWFESRNTCPICRTKVTFKE